MNNTFDMSRGRYRKIESLFKRIYYEGVVEGLRRYAHSNNKTQYIGVYGTTLKEAIEKIEGEKESLGLCVLQKDIDELIKCLK